MRLIVGVADIQGVRTRPNNVSRNEEEGQRSISEKNHAAKTKLI